MSDATDTAETKRENAIRKNISNCHAPPPHTPADATAGDDAGRIAEIRERAAKATPVDHLLADFESNRAAFNHRDVPVCRVFGAPGVIVADFHGPNCRADAELFIHATADYRLLLSRLAAAQAEVGRLRDAATQAGEGK
jgi:hypothetical protein